MSRIVAAVLVAAAVLLPSAAHAERWTGADPRKDVAGFWFSPDPAPCGSHADVDATGDKNDDLVRLTARHADRAVWLKGRFRDLEEESEQWVTFRLRTPAARWELDVNRFRTDAGKVRVMGFIGRLPKNAPRDDCGTTTFAYTVVGEGCRVYPEVDTDADTVRAHVARRCLGKPRWIEAGVYANGWVEPTDPEDPSSTVFSDSWDAFGSYGPRLYRGAS
ncbi:hypothetical protein [Nocardioides panacisoli]|uniref:hypothetical protein n=1 Tax=Nocardioides panacisoli TaxID=627624 RepID=UPI0031D6A073